MNLLLKMALGGVVAYLLLKPKKAAAAPVVPVVPATTATEAQVIPGATTIRRTGVMAEIDAGLLDGKLELRPEFVAQQTMTITPTGPISDSTKEMSLGLKGRWY